VAPGRRDGEDDLEPEERLQQLPQAEALSTYVAGVAHDFNNALSVILGGLALVEAKLGPSGILTDVLADMRTAALTGSQLAMRLMQLGRTGEPPAPESVEVARLVNRTSGVMRRRMAPSVSLDVEVPEGLVVHGVEVDLHLVVMNLIINARDAMPSGGMLTITATRSALDAARAATMQVPAGDYVELVVRDTGAGMDDDTKARVFETPFTTKPAAQGTGLGLAMAQSVVRRHGGTITVESSVGAGSTFTVWLPAEA
jgi:signal transduction histidine kinase